MRIQWKLLGSAGFAVAIVGVLIVRSGDVAGDTPDSAPSQPPPTTVDSDPSLQYELGPHAIRYEDLTAEQQAEVDRMGEATSSGQPSTSHQAFARAARELAERARVETAAAQLGLTGIDEQGVIP